jgi:arylsulfatase A-like enzyme
MWEGGLRVPFVARWPGHLPAGAVSDQWVTSLDLFPTFARIAGASLPADVELDGRDILAVLQGEAESPWTEMFWERRSDRAARVGPWKWVQSSKGGGLFDLRSDLGERADLSQERPDVLRRVQARFAAWKEAMDASPPRGPFRDY